MRAPSLGFFLMFATMTMEGKSEWSGNSYVQKSVINMSADQAG